MAKRNKQSTSPGKGLFAAFLAAGGTALLYSMLFPLHRWGQYAIIGGLSLVIGRVAYIMFSGLDTSRQSASMTDLPVTGDDVVDRLIARGQEMLKQIRREDELIPDPELSSQIVELEKIAGRIFQTVIDQPGKAPQIRRFMDYYLPTTLKMLTGYRRLTVVLGAFSKQLETLYQNDMLDITTDIDVLETMLKQDSLLGSDFKIQDSSDTGTAQAGAQAHMKEETK